MASNADDYGPALYYTGRPNYSAVTLALGLTWTMDFHNKTFDLQMARSQAKRAEHQRRLSPSSAARGAWDPPAAGSPSGDDPSGPARATDPKAFHRQHPITNYDVFNSNAFQPKPCQPLPVRQTSYLCGRT